MKDIDLCGFGNGLVDLQFNVIESELEALSIEKGAMILVDTDTQLNILNNFNKENLNRCSGGSAANTIIAFSQLGGKAAYNTVLGNDDFGHFYANEFEELGIILIAEKKSEAPTGTCVVFITPDSERTLYTSLGATAYFNSEHINEEIIERSKWIYIEGYKFTEQSSTDAIFKALDLCLKYDTKISVTFSDTFITTIFKENLKKVVDRADLIFCNESEAISYTQASDINEALNIFKNTVKNFVVTLGSKGSIVYWNGIEYLIPAYPTQPVDTTGAGDMYAGAFLYGLIHHNEIDFAGNLASMASSMIVSQYGARSKTDLNLLKDKMLIR
jgi:sugar/nucleoside kinase (ribokinase family)